MVHGLSCSVACGNLPRPGHKPVCPALAGGFLTTVPPEKSPFMVFDGAQSYQFLCPMTTLILVPCPKKPRPNLQPISPHLTQSGLAPSWLRVYSKIEMESGERVGKCYQDSKIREFPGSAG